MYIDKVCYSSYPGLSFLEFKEFSTKKEFAETHRVVLYEIESLKTEQDYKNFFSYDIHYTLDITREIIQDYQLDLVNKFCKNYTVYTNNIVGKKNYGNVVIEPFFIKNYFKYKPVRSSQSNLDYKTFLFMVGKNRYHRLTLLYHLYEKGLFSKGHISYFLGDQDNFGNKNWDYTKTLPDYLKLFLNNIPSKQTLDVDRLTRDTSQDYTFEAAYYLKSKFVIVAETEVGEDNHFFTEKLTKCVLLDKPFILLASPYSLSKVKSYYLKYFNKDISHLTDWVDTSYDTIVNLEKRCEVISQLVYTNTKYLL